MFSVHVLYDFKMIGSCETFDSKSIISMCLFSPFSLGKIIGIV